MSELRNKMIQQMQLKGYSKNTIATYIECLVCLSNHYQTSPDLLSVDQIREYIQHKLTVGDANEILRLIKSFHSLA